MDKKLEKLDKIGEMEEKRIEKLVISEYKKSLTAVNFFLSEMYRKHDKGEGLTYAEVHRLGKYEELTKQINKEITNLTGKKVEILHSSLFNLYRFEYETTGNIVEDELRRSLGLPKLNLEQVQAAIQNPISGLTLDERLITHELEVKNKVKTALVQGLILGKAYAEVSKELKVVFEGDAAKANRVVRTEAHRVKSEARQRAYEESQARGVGMKKMWVSTLDSRTRKSHGKLDGVVIDVDDYFTIRGHKSKTPGNFGVAAEDVNCRCRTVIRFEEQELKTRTSRGESGFTQKENYLTYKEYEKRRK